MMLFTGLSQDLNHNQSEKIRLCSDEHWKHNTAKIFEAWKDNIMAKKIFKIKLKYIFVFLFLILSVLTSLFSTIVLSLAKSSLEQMDATSVCTDTVS